MNIIIIIINQFQFQFQKSPGESLDMLAPTKQNLLCSGRSVRAVAHQVEIITMMMNYDDDDEILVETMKMIEMVVDGDLFTWDKVNLC